MSGESFYNEMSKAIEPYIDYNSDWCQQHEILDAILAMPEMEQIRKFIRDTAIDNGITMDDEDHPFWRLSDGGRMSQSVIYWTTGGPL